MNKGKKPPQNDMDKKTSDRGDAEVGLLQCEGNAPSRNGRGEADSRLPEGVEAAVLSVIHALQEYMARVAPCGLLFPGKMVTDISVGKGEAKRAGSVTLGSTWKDPVIVKGKQKHLGSFPRWKVIDALVRAADQGLSKDELEAASPNARRILRELKRSDPDWGEVIMMAEIKGNRYRIL